MFETDFPHPLSLYPEVRGKVEETLGAYAKLKAAGKIRWAGCSNLNAEQLRDALVAVGVFVDAIGTTKGRGFEGVVKRHRFAGGDSTHGAKGWHRRSGAIGQRLFPGTVMRGMKMPGHMGQVTRTTQNLEIIQVLEADNLLLIKGAIPGSEGDYVIIRESKKRPQGWKAPVATVSKKKADPKTAGAKK